MYKPRLIFFEGIDGSGKTTKAKFLLKNSNDGTLSYFRSSFQMGSRFANRKIDLEESMRHDWRILWDFITQLEINRTVFVDRGFISSYVYSKVLRNTDLGRYLIQYIRMFKDSAQFFFFIRKDYLNIEPKYREMNDLYLMVHDYMKRRGCEVRMFLRTEDDKFKTTDFMDFHAEIESGRLDTSYYDKEIDRLVSLLTQGERRRGIVVLDLDGTLIEPGFPEKKWGPTIEKNASYIRERYKDAFYVVMTGRPEVEEQYRNLIRTDILQSKKVYFITNNRNLGLSSRVLKTFCFGRLINHGIPFVSYDDRNEVKEYASRILSIDNVEYIDELKLYRFERSRGDNRVSLPLPV